MQEVVLFCLDKSGGLKLVFVVNLLVFSVHV